MVLAAAAALALLAATSASSKVAGSRTASRKRHCKGRVTRRTSSTGLRPSGSTAIWRNGQFKSRAIAKKLTLEDLKLEDNVVGENEVRISAVVTIDYYTEVNGNNNVPRLRGRNGRSDEGVRECHVLRLQAQPGPERLSPSHAYPNHQREVPAEQVQGHTVHFRSSCLAEAVMEPRDCPTCLDSASEAEFEGNVDFWPGVNNKGTHAVLTIHAKDEKGASPTPEIDIGLERGVTCNEPDPNSTSSPPYVVEVGGNLESPAVPGRPQHAAGRRVGPRKPSSGCDPRSLALPGRWARGSVVTCTRRRSGRDPKLVQSSPPPSGDDPAPAWASSTGSFSSIVPTSVRTMWRRKLSAVISSSSASPRRCHAAALISRNEHVVLGLSVGVNARKSCSPRIASAAWARFRLLDRARVPPAAATLERRRRPRG